jgi:hypothetical protein
MLQQHCSVGPSLRGAHTGRAASERRGARRLPPPLPPGRGDQTDHRTAFSATFIGDGVGGPTEPRRPSQKGRVKTVPAPSARYPSTGVRALPTPHLAASSVAGGRQWLRPYGGVGFWGVVCRADAGEASVSRCTSYAADQLPEPRHMGLALKLSRRPRRPVDELRCAARVLGLCSRSRGRSEQYATR